MFFDREEMQSLAHDPYRLVPPEFPPHPRVLVTPARISRTRARLASCGWVRLACDRLLEKAGAGFPVPASWTDPRQPSVDRALHYALQNALAFALTDEPRYRDEARRLLRAVAGAAPGWSHPGWDGNAERTVRLAQNHLRFFALAYDTLAAVPLPPDEEALFRGVLTGMADGLDANAHFSCSNHNAWNITARLAVAAALGDRQGVHDACYGCFRTGQWRYGLVHQLQHDLLADGMHWERTLGYHYYTLMGLTETADIAANIGGDVWRLQAPALLANDGRDVHRDYGPAGVKTFKWFYDAPFHQMFANRDFALLHDSGLANFRGVWIWGLVYNLAYQAYGDPRYAWLLDLVETENREKPVAGLPMQLQTWAEYYDFIRMDQPTYPGGAFSLEPDAPIGLTGRHTQGCSLFPSHGSAILRQSPTDTRAAGVYLFFGPHAAGHQGPAALHIELHAGGWRRTDAPQLAGYDDPRYLTWGRTTIAHNTVTVDETPMYPYGPETASMWEADIWHDRVSDGELLFFQTEKEFKALRAANANVYPGVRLDRTVILTADGVLDVYRVVGDRPQQYDWAMHVIGRPDLPPDAVPADLGPRRGYCHFRNAREWPAPPAAPRLAWRDPRGTTRAVFALPPGARLFAAEDYLPPDNRAHNYGALEAPAPRATVILRTAAAQAVFISLWVFDDPVHAPALQVAAAPPAGEIVLETTVNARTTGWRLPFAPGRVLHET